MAERLRAGAACEGQIAGRDRPHARRLRRSGSISRDDDAPEGEDIAGASDAPEPSSNHGDSKVEAASLLRAVRQSAEPLRAADVATMLLAARSITMSVMPFAEILRRFAFPLPS